MLRLHRARVFVCSSALLAASSAAALAGNIVVPRDHRTVEDALAVAAPGDRIVVVGGALENLIVSKSDVEIVAKGTTVRGYVWIDGANVRLSGLRLGPDAHVVITGNDVTVSGLRTAGRGRRVITVQGGDRATIRGNRMSAGDIEVLYGDGAAIEGNRIGSGSIVATSAGARVEKNVVQNIGVLGDGAEVLGNSCRWLNAQGNDCDVSGNRAVIGLRVDGDGATVQANQNVGRSSLTVVGDAALVLGNETTERGIQVWGDDAVVVDNSISETHHGIDVVGERFTIAENQLEVSGLPQRVPGEPVPTDNPAISTWSEEGGSAILDNVIEHYGNPGIVVDGTGVTVSGNDVHGIAAGTSIQLTGDGNLALGNTIDHSSVAQGLGDGIAIVGNDNVVRENVVDSVPLDAILVWSGTNNVVEGNDIDAVPGCGIVVTCGASLTTVSDCMVTGCRFGLVNEGAGTSLTDTSTTGNDVADILDLSTGFSTFEDNTFVTISHDRVIAPTTSLLDPPIVREGPITID